MSKRYGRNQKRRHRQAEADLRIAINSDQALIKRQRQAIDEMAGVIKDTSRVLSPHFATLPAKEQQVDHMGSILLPALDIGPRYVSTKEQVADLTYQLHRLETLQARGRLEPSGQLHMRLLTPTGAVGYSISPGAFKGFDRQRLADHLAQEISRLLLADKEFQRFAGIGGFDGRGMAVEGKGE